MNIYHGMMKTAVRIKRILSGFSAQTKYTEYLERVQYKTPGELKALQAVSLCELLNHAVEHIPYYSSLKGKMQLTPETVFSDINMFPLIEKSELIEKRELFIADNIDIIKELKTSGTMGDKACMAMDREQYMRAPDEYFNKLVGMVPGKSRLILKADDLAPEANKIGGFDYEIKRMAGVYRVDHRNMNKEKIAFILDILRKRKPRIVWGNTHGAYVLAGYIEKNNIKVPPVELFICGGQTMLPQYSKTIEKVFNTRVYDRYGSVESGNTANQCKEQKGYHYIPTVHFIEILDKNHKRVGENETGNLYITTLTKRAMPIIRYNTGDLAVYTAEKCSCGIAFPVIKSILGRRKEGIISPAGTYLSLSPLNLIMYRDGAIKDFQMVQTAEDSLVISLIADKNPPKADSLEQIKIDIRNSLDYNMSIEFKLVKEIKALSNGKMLRIIPLERKDELNESI